jgi:THO complex subunit 2
MLGDLVKGVIFSCSEYEARNYGAQRHVTAGSTLWLIGSLLGRFLLGVLADSWKWHQDEALWDQDNRMKSGGKTITLPGMQSRWIPGKDVVQPSDIVTWGIFKTILKKWHRKLMKVRTSMFARASDRR